MLAFAVRLWKVIYQKLTKPVFSSGAASSATGSGRLAVLVSPLRKLALMLGSRFWLTCLLALVIAL